MDFPDPLEFGVLSAFAEEMAAGPCDPVDDLDQVILPQDLTRAVSAVVEAAPRKQKVSPLRRLAFLLHIDRSTNDHDRDQLH